MRKLLFIFCSLFWLSVNAQIYEKGISKELAEQRSQNISDINYNLTFDIPADQRSSLSGSVVMVFILQEQADVVLDFQGKISSSGFVNGKKRTLKVQNDHIVLPAKFMTEGFNRIEIQFTSLNTALSRHDNYLYTRFAPNMVHTCFPCFDQADLHARFTTKLNVPNEWKTMSSDGHHPIPTYMYSFVAGQFQEKTRTGDAYAMRALYMETDPSKTSQLDNIFDEAGQALQWMKDYTGLAYPFSEYGLVILPDNPSECTENPGVVQISERRTFLGQNPSKDDLQERSELIAHETAHQWYGNTVSSADLENAWPEIIANFLASKITRRQLSRLEQSMNFLNTYQAKSTAIDCSEGTHSIAEALTTQDEAAMLTDDIAYDKATVAMHVIEQLASTRKMQSALQKFLIKYYFNNASWNDFIQVLSEEVPNTDFKKASDVWFNEKGIPQIHTEYQNGKLTVTQTDPNGRGMFWRQKFDIRVVNELGESRTLNIDMDKPTMSFNLHQTPSHIVPNYNGNGYGRFTLDKEYTKRLALRLIVTRDELQRHALLHTLHDNYLMGRIPPSYFGELYRNMTKEKNPLIMQTCIDHMFKIAFDRPTTERQTLEQCIMDLIPENKHSECRRIIIQRMARNATSPDVLNQIYRIWKDHKDPLFNEHDYMEMAYRLAITRPNEWQQILSTERQMLKTDMLRQEFDYVSRACNPDVNKQQQLFNELLEPQNRSQESWALHLLQLLNADIREKQGVSYINASLNSLEQLQQTSGGLFTSKWLHVLFASHKSTKARQEVEQFLRQHSDFPSHLRYKVLEAAWPLMNISK